VSFQFPDLRFSIRTAGNFQRKLRHLVVSVMEEKGLTKLSGKAVGVRVHMQVERRKSATKDYPAELLHDAARSFNNALQGIVYEDGAQVAQCLVTKAYGECNWTMVSVWEVQEKSHDHTNQ
jgi:hypothetical protein